ncbi:MAG: sulfatase-like hydrolase/transferase [bacterium]|nr:sulfatase-like hydrolase/transferase [bacterium]
MENKPRGIRHIRRTAFVLIIAFLLLNTGLFIRGKRTPAGAPNIVLIVVDCLRADHLGYYGCHRNTSPVIDGLAKEGMVFENAFSNTSWTKPSVASLFTSLYPNRHGVITMTDIFPVPFLTMAEILKNNGYYTACFIGGNSFLREEFNYQQGFDLFKNDGYEESPADILTDTFLDAVSPPSQRKFFAYIHYMDVHLPYHKNEYNGLFMEKGIKTPFTPFEFGKHSLRESTADGTLPEETKNRLVSVYDGQIRCVDEQIGRIISVLKQRNMLENTLVVITSDHGEELWDHNNFEHGHTLYNELIHVPLILVGNKLTHKKVKTPVTLVDLLPTFLARANIRNGTLKLQGNDLLNSREADGRKAFASGTLYNDEKYCLIDEENWKLIINTGDETEKNKLIGFSNKDQFELYDLNSDPLEKENLKDAEPAKLVRLRKELEQRVNVKSIFKRKKTVIDRKTRDRLKSLGYL